MIRLLDLEEMERRHKGGEDPFDLAIEKWIRIKDFLMEKADAERYKQAYQCGLTKIIFCLDYQTYCHLCPLNSVCSNNESLYYQIMRHLNVYSLVGTLLPRGPLVELMERYIRDMDERRKEWLKKSH